MMEQESGQALLQRFWQALLEAPPPPPQTLAAAPALIDDEFDFLGEAPAPQPSAQTHMALTPQRLARMTEFAAQLSELVDVLGDLRDDPRLDRIDGAGALWLCRLLLLTPTPPLAEHGALLRLLQRAARSPDPELVVAAAEAILHLDARAAQLDLVARLHADPRSLGHAGVDRVLAALKQIADGRCVREMEALLVARGDELSDVHAWQARHIVQVIRRSGRK
jgi:hypothetical protein